MNKDDMELFNKIKERIYYPILISKKIAEANTVEDLLESIDDVDYRWNLFYPSNENKIVSSFPYKNLWYSVETIPIIVLNDKIVNTYTNKIKKEVNEILCGKEAYYYKKLNNKDNVKEVEKILKESISKANPNQESFEFLVYELGGFKYAMAGKNKPHLSRTAVYFSNIN